MRHIISLSFIFFIVLFFLGCDPAKTNNNENNIYIEKYSELFKGYIIKDWIKSDYFKNLDEVKNTYRKYSVGLEQNYKINFKQNLIKRINFSNMNGLIRFGSQAHGIIEYPILEYVNGNGDILFGQVNYSGGVGSSLFNYNTNIWKRFNYIKYENNKEISQLKRTVRFHNNIFNLFTDYSNLNYYIKDGLVNKVIINRDLLPFGIGDNGFLLNNALSKSFYFGATIDLYFKNNKNIFDKIIYIYDYDKQIVQNIFIYPFSNYYGFISGDYKDKIYLCFGGVAPYRPEEAEALFKFKPDTGHIMIHEINTGKIYNIYFNEMDEHSRGGKIIGGVYVLGEDDSIYYQLVTDQAYFIYRITPLWNEPMEKTEYKPYFFEFLPEIKKEWDALQDSSKGEVK
jgi:hypothetical protein